MAPCLVNENHCGSLSHLESELWHTDSPYCPWASSSVASTLCPWLVPFPALGLFTDPVISSQHCRTLPAAACAALPAASSSLVEQPSSCWSPVPEFVVSYIQLGCHSGFPARGLKLGVLIANWIKFYYTGVVHELELLPFCELIEHQANVFLDANVSFPVIIKCLWKIVRAGWLNRTTLLNSAHTPTPGALSGQGAPCWLLAVSAGGSCHMSWCCTAVSV